MHQINGCFFSQAASWVENDNTVLIDASTAFRVDDDWTYGFPGKRNSFVKTYITMFWLLIKLPIFNRAFKVSEGFNQIQQTHFQSWMLPHGFHCFGSPSCGCRYYPTWCPVDCECCFWIQWRRKGFDWNLWVRRARALGCLWLFNGKTCPCWPSAKYNLLKLTHDPIPFIEPQASSRNV